MSDDFFNLVEQLAGEDWSSAQAALERNAPVALDAIVTGARHANPDVRKRCIALMDHHADERCVPVLLAGLEDPVADVRRNAVHSVGCQSCKGIPLAIDVVGLLIARVQRDLSIRVQRSAVHMLGNQPPDERAARFLWALMGQHHDAKLLRTAEWSFSRHEAAWMSSDRPVNE